MELVKPTPEEQAKIDHDRRMPHAVVVLLGPMSENAIFQTAVAEMIEAGMLEIKRRADSAKMIVLSTSISTNTPIISEVVYLSVMILCQWAEIEKLEEQQRRQFLATAGGPGRRA